MNQRTPPNVPLVVRPTSASYLQHQNSWMSPYGAFFPERHTNNGTATTVAVSGKTIKFRIRKLKAQGGSKEPSFCMQIFKGGNTKMSKLTVDVIAKLNKQLSKSSINNDLKSLNNTMYVRVLAKLSKTLASRELKKQLKELDNMKVNVGTKIKVNKSTEAELRKSIK